LKFWEREFGEATPLAKITTSKIEKVKLRRVQEVSPATVDKSVAFSKHFSRGATDRAFSITTRFAR
jgi:hypothetical protein